MTKIQYARVTHRLTFPTFFQQSMKRVSQMSWEHVARRPGAVAAAVAAALIISAAGRSAMAEPAADAAEVEGETIGTVIVTGSRIAGRTVLQSEAPIEIFSAQELKNANKTDLLESLQVQVPSLNMPSTPSNGLASRVIRGAYLRSLSPGETLVLVNGRRRHTTASVGAGGSDAAQPADLGLFPTAAIERIEVLLDGASALYGSDAIAGVINIITRKEDTGGEFYTRSGAYFSSEGFNWTARGGSGFRLGEEGHVYVSAEAGKRQRTYRGAPAPDDMLYYFPISNTTGLPVNPASRPGGPSATGSGIANALSAPFLPAGAHPDPREATRNSALQQIAGLTPYKLFALTVDAGLPVWDGAELYSLSTYSYRDAQSFNGFRLPDRNENIRSIYPDGYSPINTQIENDFEQTLGLKGGWGEWSWDLSSDYGGNYANIGSINTVNPSFGLDSQTRFKIGGLGFQSWVSNFDIRRSLNLPFTARPSELSAGVEYRRDYFQITPGDYQSYANGGQVVLDGPNKGLSLAGPGGDGAQATYGYRPQEAVDSQRRNTAAYVGLAVYPFDRWLINLAARNEDYSDVGNSWVGRFSTRFEVTPHLALRGTVSNGFQAPTLGTQAMQKLQNWNTYVGYTLAVSSAGAAAFGAKPLDPEKSRNYSVGFVAQLPRNINLTLDAYQVDVDNRIALSTQVRASNAAIARIPGAQAAVLALLQKAGLPDTVALVSTVNDPSLNFFINAANTRSRGLEGTLEGTESLGGLGRLHWNLSANYNKTTIRSYFQTPPELAQYGVSLFATGTLNNLTNLTPRDKEILGLTWLEDRWSVTVRGTHYGKMPRFVTVTNFNYPQLAGQQFEFDNGSLFITDLDAAFAVTDHLRFTAGITNAFDRRPTKLTGPLTAATAQWSYTEDGPISSDGGSYVAGFQYNW